MLADCSIIIRCYNEAIHLPKLLHGIAQQTIKNVEIIAVDSGSTDQTPQILRSYGIKTLFLEPEQFSFGRSCNMGCQIAQGQFLVFVSAHAYPVYRTWLEDLLKPFQDPLVGISYGKQRGNFLNSYSERQIFKAWYPEQDQTSQKHPFCNNANSAVRRTVWETFRFNEELTGLEDVDLAKRAAERRYKIAYVGAAEVVHVHQEGPATVRHRFRREALAYRQIFPYEKMSFLQFCKLYIGNVVSDCHHALGEGVFLRTLSEIMQFRLMQFWGAYQGMRQYGPVTDQLKRRFYYPPELKSDKVEQTNLPIENIVEYKKINE